MKKLKKMKRIIYIALITFLLSCSPSKKESFELKELFELTDSFVESLQTTYDSYGILGGRKHMKTTTDGQYQVMPFERLINVKILKVVNDDVYKDLEEDLESHYKNDKRVNDVYISNAGTIMIDCRN
jgi:hypothetical protein